MESPGYIALAGLPGTSPGPRGRRSPSLGDYRRKRGFLPGKSLKSRRSGFTLVELVLSSLLVVIIGGVLFAGYFYSARAIRVAKTGVLRSETAAVFLSGMAGEIAGVDGAEHAFSGTENRLLFTTSARTESGLVRVGYRIEEDGSGPGVVILRFEGLAWEKTDQAGDWPGSRPVFQARNLEFAYYDGSEWLEEWNFPEIPLLVALRLSMPWGNYEVWARPRTGTGLDPGADPDALPDGD